MIVLLFPWVICLLLLFALVLVFKKNFLVAALVLLISVGLNLWCKCFAFNFSEGDVDKRSAAFKVLTFNMNGEHEISSAAERLNFILLQDADIIFLAEDFYGICKEVDSVLKVSHPYSTYDYNLSHYFYSKFPLSKAVRLAEAVDDRACVVKTVAKIGNDSILLVGCHLSSNNYTKDYVDVRSLPFSERMGAYVVSIQNASQMRVQEAQAICDNLGGYKTLVMGDMNDVCGSPCMRVFEKAGLKNAWWECGLGYGATIREPLPYRIDHLMYGNGLKLKGIEKVCSKGLSDHDALVAEFEIGN